MSNRPIFITGCQRSGTTLLNLVMDSHPDVQGVDEMQFDGRRILEYLTATEFGPNVCLKLPPKAHDLDLLRSLPGIHILWAVRDPRDVVASMTQLRINAGGVTERMAAHPYAGARAQVPLMLHALGNIPHDLESYIQGFAEQVRTPPERRSPEQLAVTAALHWRLKQELLYLYEKASLDYRVVCYETLVSEPRTEISRILEYLNLRWHADVLRHHQLHTGMSTGRTDSARAIDQSSVGRWQQVLEPVQIDRIHAICAPVAARFGYAL